MARRCHLQPAPIDIQIRGANLDANFAYANRLLSRLRHVTGIADARIQQSNRNSGFNIDVDRTRAQYIGISERDVTNSLVVNLAGSSQVSPSYWLNPDSGITYSIVMQPPQHQMDSLGALQALPVTAAGGTNAPILGGIAEISRTVSNAVVSQYNIQPVVQIYATTQGRDLGAVAADIQKVLGETASDVPKGSSVVLLGQVKTMNSAFTGLLFGLLAAVVLIYFLIVVNFQSWSDPIGVGAKAAISVPERPDRTFPAVVDSTSQAVDAASGTIRMQLIVDNEAGALLAGSFANVQVDLSRSVQPLHIPASALLFSKSGLEVATVGADGRVLLKPVKIARDLGRDIEIGSGLEASDQVIITPPDGLINGDQVRLARKAP